MGFEISNEDKMRLFIKSQGLKQWQIARHLNLSEASFSRWFRDGAMSTQRIKEIEGACRDLTKKRA